MCCADIKQYSKAYCPLQASDLSEQHLFIFVMYFYAEKVLI